MFRAGFFGRAAVVSLAFATPCVGSAESLKAIGSASATAHSDLEQSQGTLTPNPGSLSITIGVATSDGVINPSPPPDGWQMLALFDGSATARYGALSGTAHGEASSKPANPFFLAGGQLTMIVGYTDGAEVRSDTLAVGTPVTLTFSMTLDATATHVIDAVFPQQPPGTGASVRHELEVRDLDDIVQPAGQGALVINSVGTSQTFTTFEFETEVGHDLEIVAQLFVSAGADIDYASYPFTEGTADVATGVPAEVFYGASGDVRLQSESGHDYLVPEPGWAALQTSSATILLLLRWKRRRARLRMR